MAIDGYEIEEVTSGDFPNDYEFIVRVTENEEECSEEDKTGCDTDITPDTRITSNSSLADLALSPSAAAQ